MKTMIEMNNPIVQLEPTTSNPSLNSNFQFVYVSGRKQDMVLCTICSKLEFVSDGLQNHKCESTIQISDVSTMALPVLTDPSPNAVQPSTANLNKIHPRNMALIKEQLAFSFAEMFPLDGLNDTGFKAMTKYLLNVGATYGKINVTDLLGDQKTLEDERKSLLFMVKVFLKKVVANEKLVFSCDMWKDSRNLKRCITLSSHHIDDTFTLQRNVLGTRIYDENEFDGNNLVDYMTDILSEYTSTPSSILSNATIITSKTDDFLKSLRNYGRLDCVCTILNEVVNHSLALPCFETEKVCKAIIIRLERQPSNETYKSAVTNFEQTDWLTIWHLFEAYQQYLETTPSRKNIIPNYEILFTFLMEAQRASKLLSSDREATISTVYIIKKKLIEVMRGYNTGSFKWPENKDKLTSFAEKNFEITDIHRITLFLDPRYKSLKFLPKEERDALHETVRGIIGEIFIPDQNLKRVLNLGDYVSWVDANGKAEVDRYLNLNNISPDTNVLEFWKLQMEFPKLRTLAKEMLCIPAVSAAWECYFNKDKFNLSRRRLHLNLNELDTTLLLNGHSYYGMFDEQLKILFES